MRVYTIPFESISQAAARTQITMAAAATIGIVILELWMSQEASEVSEQFALRLNRLSAAGAGTSTSVTPVAHEVQDQGANDGTYAINYTAEPTTYDSDALWRDSFNILQGMQKIWTPEARIWIPPSVKVGLRLITTPSTTFTMSGGIVVGEVG